MNKTGAAVIVAVSTFWLVIALFFIIMVAVNA